MDIRSLDLRAHGQVVAESILYFDDTVSLIVGLFAAAIHTSPRVSSDGWRSFVRSEIASRRHDTGSAVYYVVSRSF